jgi:hypothetical protein
VTWAAAEVGNGRTVRGLLDETGQQGPVQWLADQFPRKLSA